MGAGVDGLSTKEKKEEELMDTDSAVMTAGRRGDGVGRCQSMMFFSH